MAAEAIMLAYSPKKKRANFMELYSVWYPPTSSDSDSGRSNGRRLVSAKDAIRKMTKASGCLRIIQPCSAWYRMMSLKLRLSVRMKIGITLMPMAIS